MGSGTSRRESPRPCLSGCWPSWAGSAKAREARPCSRTLAKAAPAASGSAPFAAEGQEILSAVLAIERCCLGSPRPSEVAEAPRAELEAATQDDSIVADLGVECLLNEPELKYFLCSSLSSPIITAYFRIHYADVCMEDLRRALVDCQERQLRDTDSEYQVLRSAEESDPTQQEDISFVLRVPWPFSDREILQRRCQLPIRSEGRGLAIVMRSFEDEALFPAREDRVRAFVHKSAYLLRPLKDEDGVHRGTEAATSGGPPGPALEPEGVAGLELVVCQQIDIGGLCPAWAQSFITRFAVQSAVDWSKKLREHCIQMRQRRGEVPQQSQGSGVDEAASKSTPSSSSAQERQPMTGEKVLEAILAIERRCRCASLGSQQGPPSLPRAAATAPKGEEDAEASGKAEAAQRDPTSTCGPPLPAKRQATDGDLNVECLLDEPASKYCLCYDLDSPVVTGYIRVQLPGVFPGDVLRALVTPEERLLRDPNSEYQVLRTTLGNPTREEDVTFVYRAMWPFWDRDVLVRRWIYPLHEGEGLAIVMRSIEDEHLLPSRGDRIRAFIHKCCYLLRPLEPASGQGEAASAGEDCSAGLELTVCMQVDVGGLCPDWAQDVLVRWTIIRGLQWAEELREHCNRQHAARTKGSCADGPPAEPAEPAPEPAPAEEGGREWSSDSVGVRMEAWLRECGHLSSDADKRQIASHPNVARIRSVYANTLLQKLAAGFGLACRDAGSLPQHCTEWQGVRPVALRRWSWSGCMSSST